MAFQIPYRLTISFIPPGVYQPHPEVGRIYCLLPPIKIPSLVSYTKQIIIYSSVAEHLLCM
uniref:Uncharacterized protein n=1 Tax=Octopus bimaculoides TaxID=37653 RepID=A0A0L8GVF2_OCTBM